MTTAPKTPLHRRVMAAMLLLAATLAVAVSMSTAAPASAGPAKFIALSYSPSTQAYGWSTGTNEQQAVTRSLYECSIRGNQCVFVGTARNSCIAVSAFQQNYAIGRGMTRQEALLSAAHALARSNVLYAGCA